jgi:hypothetical protein
MAVLVRRSIGGGGAVSVLPLRPMRRHVLVPEVMPAEREGDADDSMPSPSTEGYAAVPTRWLGLLVDVYG